MGKIRSRRWESDGLEEPRFALTAGVCFVLCFALFFLFPPLAFVFLGMATAALAAHFVLTALRFHDDDRDFRAAAQARSAPRDEPPAE